MAPKAARRGGSAAPEADEAGRATRSSPARSRGRPRAGSKQQHNKLNTSNLDPALSTVVEQQSHQDVASVWITGQAIEAVADTIDPEAVEFELPKLHAEAETIFKRLKQQVDAGQLQLAEALADENSVLHQRINRSYPALQNGMNAFGANGGFIHPDAVEIGAFRGHVEDLQYAHAIDLRLNHIIYKINLARWVCEIVGWFNKSRDDPYVQTELSILDAYFPAPFVSSLVPEETGPILPSGASTLYDLFLSISVGLRTQVSILAIAARQAEDPRVDPSIVLREVFYDTQGNHLESNEQFDEYPFRAWANDLFSLGSLPDKAGVVKEWLTRVDVFLPDEEGEKAFEPAAEDDGGLEKRLSVETLVVESLQGCVQRFIELSEQIARRSGAEQIVNEFVELQRKDSKEIAQFVAEQSRLHQLQQQTFELAPDANGADPLDHDFSSNIYATPGKGSSRSELLATYAQKAQGSLQGQGSLLDAQQNGQKILFDSQPPGNQFGRSPFKKRKRGEDDEEVSDDEGPKQKRGPASLPPNSSIRESDLELSNPSQLNPGGVPTQGHAGTQEWDNKLTQIGDMYSSVQKISKAKAEDRKARAKADEDRKVQARKKWSQDETAALIAYIEELGTSWAMIHKEDAARGKILSSRDQVALKDKARNLKFEFLKAGVALHENFELVSLSKSMREKLVKWEMSKVEEQPPRELSQLPPLPQQLPPPETQEDSITA